MVEPVWIVSIGTVVTIMAIVPVPGISFSISIRSGLSFPLLLSKVSIVSIGMVAIVTKSIAIMSQSIGIPGVSFSIGISNSSRSGLSFPLFLSVYIVSIRTVTIVTKSIAIMSQSMSIIGKPRVGCSISNSVRSGLSFPLLLSEVSIVSIRTVVDVSIAIMP